MPPWLLGMMEKARDISIVGRVPSPLVSQAQPMPNASKPAPLNAPFDDQEALNKALKYHAVSPRETHEKPPDFGGREANSQCFLQYLMQPVATRLSTLTNVTRISGLTSSSSSSLNQAATFLAVACAIPMGCGGIQAGGEDKTGGVDDAVGASDADAVEKAAAIAAWMMLSSSAFWAAVKHEVTIPIDVDVRACWRCCRHCCRSEVWRRLMKSSQGLFD